MGFIKSMLMRMLKRGTLRPMESQVLEYVGRYMDPKPGEVMRRQLKLYNHIQRLDKGRDVSFYVIKNGRCSFPEDAKFSVKNEFELAKLRLVDRSSGHGSDVSVLIVNGRLFSLRFSLPPGDLDSKTTTISGTIFPLST